MRLLVYVILLVSLAVSVKLVKDIVKLNKIDERLLEADRELELAKGQQLDLEKQLDEIQGPDWWEAQIRNTLRMAKENEVVVVIPEEIIDKSDLSSGYQEAEEELEQWQKWWQVFAD